MHPDDFQAVLHRDADRATIRVRGDIDLMTAPGLDRALYDAGLGSPSHLVVDLTDVGFLGAQALGVLAIAANRLRAAERRLTVEGLTAFQLKIVCLCGLEAALSVGCIATASRTAQNVSRRRQGAVGVAGVEPATLRL